MSEVYVAVQHLCIAIAILVIVQTVRVYQIDAFVLFLLLARRTLLGWSHGEYHAQQHNTYYDKQEPLHFLLLTSYS